MTTPPPLLELRGLTHSYNNTPSTPPLFTIRALSLAAGQCALLTGKNGAGKSTLLRLLAGLLPPSRCDHFAFNGRPGLPPQPPAPAIGYAPQTPYLFNTSVRKNVEYGLRRCRLPLSRADEAMQWAGIAHLKDAAAQRLSGGEARRVALARIRALRPRLYLLDEPLTHLDDEGKARVRDLILTLQREGATCVVSSHHGALPAAQLWHLQHGALTITSPT